MSGNESSDVRLAKSRSLFMQKTKTAQIVRNISLPRAHISEGTFTHLAALCFVTV